MTTELLEKAFRAGVAAADPARALQGKLPPPPTGRLLLIAVGKAAGSMAGAAVRHYLAQGVQPEGLVISPAGTTVELPGLRQLPGGHPNPTWASQLAGEAVLDLLADAGAHDLVLCLISGGASAMMVAPAGISLAEFIGLNEQLLASGADIRDMNTVRRKLCQLKGGGLARASGAADVVALVLSDVVGDDPAAIASGPTVADPDTPADALAVLQKYGIRDRAVTARLTQLQEAWEPGAVHASTAVIGSGRLSLEAAARELEQAGWPTRLLSAEVTGDATAAAAWHAARIRELRDSGQRLALLSGGETTVQLPVNAGGTGGRNTHFILALALELWGRRGVMGLSADTDGIDGSSQAAGGWFSPALFAAASATEARAALEGSGSADFLARYGHTLVTGPTGTNVNDLRIMLVEE